MQLIDAHKGNQVNIREDAIWEYLAQICHGLHYLHQKRILHRDIKARNIFLDGDLNVKVREKKKKKMSTHHYFLDFQIYTAVFFYFVSSFSLHQSTNVIFCVELTHHSNLCQILSVT